MTRVYSTKFVSIHIPNGFWFIFKNFGVNQSTVNKMAIPFCSSIGGHSEQESTLNQLLVEMDGKI